MNNAEIALTAQNILDLQNDIAVKSAVLDPNAFSGAVVEARQNLVTLQDTFPNNAELQSL